MNNMYKGNDRNADLISHYGVLGMKWGRRKQKYSAYSYQRKLNTLSKKSSKAYGNYMRYDMKAKQSANKNKIDKTKKYSSKSKAAYKESKKSNSEIKKVINNALNSNYSVNSKHVKRNTEAGRMFARTLLIGYGPSAIYTYHDMKKYLHSNNYKGQSPYSVNSTRYKVHKTKK